MNQTLHGAIEQSSLTAIGEFATAKALAPATREPLRNLPHRMDAAALVDVMEQIGCPLPGSAKKLAANGVSLSACGVAYTIGDVDAALDKTALNREARMIVKMSMLQAGLLRK